MKYFLKSARLLMLLLMIMLAAILPIPIPQFNKEQKPKFLTEQVDKKEEENEEQEILEVS